MDEVKKPVRFPCSKYIDIWILVFLISAFVLLFLTFIAHWSMIFMVLICYWVYLFRALYKGNFIPGLIFQKQNGTKFVEDLKKFKAKPTVILKGEAYHYIKKAGEKFKEVTFKHSQVVEFEFFYDSSPDLAYLPEVKSQKNVSSRPLFERLKQIVVLNGFLELEFDQESIKKVTEAQESFGRMLQAKDSRFSVDIFYSIEGLKSNVLVEPAKSNEFGFQLTRPEVYIISCIFCCQVFHALLLGKKMEVVPFYFVKKVSFSPVAKWEISELFTKHNFSKLKGKRDLNMSGNSESEFIKEEEKNEEND